MEEMTYPIPEDDEVLEITAEIVGGYVAVYVRTKLGDYCYSIEANQYKTLQASVETWYN